MVTDRAKGTDAQQMPPELALRLQRISGSSADRLIGTVHPQHMIMSAAMRASALWPAAGPSVASRESLTPRLQLMSGRLAALGDRQTPDAASTRQRETCTLVAPPTDALDPIEVGIQRRRPRLRPFREAVAAGGVIVGSHFERVRRPCLDEADFNAPPLERPVSQNGGYRGSGWRLRFGYRRPHRHARPQRTGGSSYVELRQAS